MEVLSETEKKVTKGGKVGEKGSSKQRKGTMGKVQQDSSVGKDAMTGETDDNSITWADACQEDSNSKILDTKPKSRGGGRTKTTKKEKAEGEKEEEGPTPTGQKKSRTAKSRVSSSSTSCADGGNAASQSTSVRRPKFVYNVFNDTGSKAHDGGGGTASTGTSNASKSFVVVGGGAGGGLNALESDDENVILKLNVSTPPAPMFPFSTNTATYAARVDWSNDNAHNSDTYPHGKATASSHEFYGQSHEQEMGASSTRHSMSETGDCRDRNNYDVTIGVGMNGERERERENTSGEGNEKKNDDDSRHRVGERQGSHTASSPTTTNKLASGGMSLEGGSCGGLLRSVRLLEEFEEKNKSGEWPSSTSVHCYWCCHPFEGPPVGIPAKFVRDKFYVYGCFCSLECAAAYNFNHNGSLDERWKRFGLLNLMASRMGHTGVVRQAPDRLALTMFGGHLDVDSFRSYCKSHERMTLVNFPPMQTMTQQVEEINESDVRSMRPSYIPFDHSRADRAQSKLVLKRSKPLVSGRNTLDKAINLSRDQAS